MTNQENDVWLTPITITAIYIVIAGLWIALSDHFLDLFVSDPEYLMLIQTYKSWFYVLITGIGLFYLIKKHDHQLTVKQAEQQKAEEKLRKRQERLQRSQQIGKIGDWEFNIRSGDISWSKSLYEIFERDPELDPPSFEKLQTDYYYRDSTAKHNHAIQQAIEEGESFDIELELQTDEGNQKYIRAIGIPTKKEGQAEKLIGIIQDITDLKQAEKELRKEKQRFELVANTTTDVIWDYNPIEKTLWWSKGFEETFGYDRASLSNDLSSWTEHIHPEDKKEATESFNKALNSDDKRWQHEYRLLRADGSTAYIIDRGKIIRNETGEAIRVVGTLNDITKRKQTEQKLRESEEKYRHIFVNNPEPMWIYNPETLEFVEVNRAAVDHYGYSQSDFLDMTLAEIRPSQDVEKLKKDVKKHRSQENYFGEWRHLKKDGTLIHVEITAANIQYKENTFRLALIHDITEQKRLQEKIIQSVIEGEDRERKRIAYELHDGLIQFLVAANMNFQSVKDRLEKLTEKRQKQFRTGLKFLKKGLEETRGIAHNLMPKAIVDYGLIAALEDLIHDHENSTDIRFHFDHNCHNLQLNNQAEINIYRIFQELVSNAVKHSDCSTIKTELRLIEDKLTILITDDGKGVKIHKLHEERGIGIRSVKTRVNSLKGSLNLNSKPGVGMRVTITIPEIHNLST